MVQGWAALQGRGREVWANKGNTGREWGAAVDEGRSKATNGKLGKGRKRKRGGRVYLCAYMFCFFMVLHSCCWFILNDRGREPPL